MAVTDYDHITALKNRLLNTKHQKEAEIREIDEMIRVLGDAPRILTDKPFQIKAGPVEVEKNEKRTPARTFQNRNVTQLTREYLEDFGVETPISVPDVVKWLQTKGVTGKYRSLYSSVHVILRKEQGKGVIAYMKGVGFYKTKVSEGQNRSVGVNHA